MVTLTVSLCFQLFVHLQRRVLGVSQVGQSVQVSGHPLVCEFSLQRALLKNSSVCVRVFTQPDVLKLMESAERESAERESAPALPCWPAFPVPDASCLCRQCPRPASQNIPLGTVLYHPPPANLRWPNPALSTPPSPSWAPFAPRAQAGLLYFGCFSYSVTYRAVRKRVSSSKLAFRSLVLVFLRLLREACSVLLRTRECRQELGVLGWLLILLFCHFRNSFLLWNTVYFAFVFLLGLFTVTFVRSWVAPCLVSSREFPRSEINSHKSTDLCKPHKQHLGCGMSCASVKVLNKRVTHLTSTAPEKYYLILPEHWRTFQSNDKTKCQKEKLQVFQVLSGLFWCVWRSNFKQTYWSVAQLLQTGLWRAVDPISQEPTKVMFGYSLFKRKQFQDQLWGVTVQHPGSFTPLWGGQGETWVSYG